MTHLILSALTDPSVVETIIHHAATAAHLTK